MIKLIHIVFVFMSFASFISRVTLLQLKPEVLQNKMVKIAPHIIDTLLLLSGITLVIHGNWLSGEYGWIISKIIVLILYIVFGVITMRTTGSKRWLAFAASVGCFVYIFVVAISKHGFI